MAVNSDLIATSAFWYALSGGIAIGVIFWNLVLLARGRTKFGAVLNLGLAFLPVIAGVVLAVLYFRVGGTEVAGAGSAGISMTSARGFGHSMMIFGIGLAGSLIALTLAIIAFFVVSRRSYRIHG